MRQLFNASPKILGPSPKKFGRPKTCKIWTDFTQLPNLITNISGTRQDISKIGKICDLERFPPRSAKQVRWTLVHYPYMWVWTHPNRFLTDHISAPRGCWPLKFLHTLDTGKGLLAHTANLVRGLPKNFKGEHLKLGLNFLAWAPITLGLVGVTSRNFTRERGSRPGWSSGH